MLSVNCVFPPELGTEALRRARVLTACRRQSSGSDSGPWPALRAPAGGRKRLLHPGGAQRRCRPRGWRRARSRGGEREPRGNTAPCAAPPQQQKLCSEVPRGKKRGAGHVGFSSVLASRDAPPFRGAPADGGIPFVSPRVRPELEPEQPGRRTVPKAPLQPRGAARRGRAARSAGSATRVPTRPLRVSASPSAGEVVLLPRPPRDPGRDPSHSEEGVHRPWLLPQWGSHPAKSGHRSWADGAVAAGAPGLRPGRPP